MALHPTGLGKGLDALIRQTQEERDTGGPRTLNITDIIPNPRQPRRAFDEKALEELAASIKSQGLLQPLLVRPIGPSNPDKYEIVAGERRWRASQMAGLKEIPVLIRPLSAQDTLAAALIENLQREDLNPLEEALGLQALKEEFGLSQEDVAHKIGKSRSAIANSLRLLQLPESMRPLLAEGKLSSGHARALLSITDPKAQEYLKNLILENRLSVREAEGLAAGWKNSGTFELAVLENLGANAQADRHPASDTGAPRVKKPQSATILEIQNRIAGLFNVPVRVTGKESKGKITLSFNSEEELRALLERLSTSVLEGSAHKALTGATPTALEGESLSELDAASRPELDADVRTALKSADHAQLDGAQREHLQGANRQALTGEDRKALEQHNGTVSENETDAE